MRGGKKPEALEGEEPGMEISIVPRAFMYVTYHLRLEVSTRHFHVRYRYGSSQFALLASAGAAAHWKPHSEATVSEEARLRHSSRAFEPNAPRRRRWL